MSKRKAFIGHRAGVVHHLPEMVESPDRLLAELIALPSVNPAFLTPDDPHGGEWRVADYLSCCAAKAGLPVELAEVFPATGSTRARQNVLVRLRPPKPRHTVLLAPHLDTVGAEDFVPKRSNGRIYGRGACDTKGSVAAMFTALLELAKSKERPRETEIIFVGLVDEENSQEGSRNLARSKVRADLGVVGEPTELRVVTAHKGDMWLKLVTKGKAAHGARPELGDNAVHQMAKAIDLLEGKYAQSLRKRKHPVLGQATINVGTVQGGTQPNIVPDLCEIQIDRRTIPGEVDAQVEQEIVSFLRRNGVRIELINSKHNECMPMETDPQLPLVRRFMAVTRQNSPLGVDFFCDAAILSAGGIPCIVFGPGNIAQAHTANEWISVRSLQRATDMLVRFLRALP